MPSDLAQLEPRRVALIKPSALGDIVHTLPVLTALRKRWPAAHLAWVVNRSYASLLNGHPHLDDVITFDRAVWSSKPLSAALSSLKFARRLRESKFDLVIDLQGLFRTGMMCLATGASRIVGFKSAREGAAKCYTDRIAVPDANAIHAVDRYWRVAEALGAADAPKQFHVHINAAARAHAAQVLAPWPRPWLVLGVGARWATKRWPPENFAAVAKSAVSRYGGSIIFIGTKEDADIAKQVNIGQPTLDLCGTTTLPQLAAVMARADAVVANDTGPLHLAAALGRPTVAPYTCTLVTRHGPYGQAHRTASATVDCHGSYKKKCDHFSCMPTLPAARLTGLLDEVLSGWVTRRPA